jgi:LemA protein
MRKQGQVGIGLLLLVAIIAGVGIYGVTSYNRMVALKENIPAAWSQVENVMQRRNDLIPNLVNTVKGYAKHEQQILNGVTEALKSFNRATTIQGKIEADTSISSLLGRILAVSVQYPNLKADQQFMRLQDELTGTENRIAVERMRFNDVVRQYNTQVKTFPTNIMARIAGFKASEEYFKGSEAARMPPTVKFD